MRQRAYAQRQTRRVTGSCADGRSLTNPGRLLPAWSRLKLPMSVSQRMQPLGVSDATAAVAKKSEVAIPHRPGPGLVAAFDCTVQIASDEFSVINQ